MRERTAHLLEQDRLLEEAEAGAAVRLGDRDPGPAELGELCHDGSGCAARNARACVAELLLLGREGEVHQRDLGRPSTRSAMMLRRISDVPASIVLPRLRSCMCCQ